MYARAESFFLSHYTNFCSLLPTTYSFPQLTFRPCLQFSQDAYTYIEIREPQPTFVLFFSLHLSPSRNLPLALLNLYIAQFLQQRYSRFENSSRSESCALYYRDEESAYLAISPTLTYSYLPRCLRAYSSEIIQRSIHIQQLFNLAHLGSSALYILMRRRISGRCSDLHIGCTRRGRIEAILIYF